jgi:hypothetical protein
VYAFRNKTAYFCVEVSIVVIVIWFGTAGPVIQGIGFNWIKACTLYVLGGFLGSTDGHFPSRLDGRWFVLFLRLIVSDRMDILIKLLCPCIRHSSCFRDSFCIVTILMFIHLVDSLNMFAHLILSGEGWGYLDFD